MARIFASTRPITTKQSAYARFSRKNISEDAANPFLPERCGFSAQSEVSCFLTPTRSRPTMLNEFRFGFTYVTTSVNFPIQGSDALSQLDLIGVNISQHPPDACLSDLQLQRRNRPNANRQGQSRNYADRRPASSATI